MKKSIIRFAKNLGGEISKNSPTILTSFAVAGVITTAIFAVRATPKAIELIRMREEAMKDSEEGVYHAPVSLPKIEAIKLTWKLYIPAIGMGLITIGCIVSSNSINQKRNTALATVYGITEAAFREYKEKVVETIGKNKEIKVRDEITEDHIKNNPKGSNEVIFTGKGEVTCYDSLTGRYFKSDIEKIRKAINELNRDLLTDMFVSVNDLYYAIGLPCTTLGDTMGWDIDKGLIEVSFSSQLSEDGEPCLAVNYEVTPKFMK